MFTIEMFNILYNKVSGDIPSLLVKFFNAGHCSSAWSKFRLFLQAISRQSAYVSYTFLDDEWNRAHEAREIYDQSGAYQTELLVTVAGSVCQLTQVV